MTASQSSTATARVGVFVDGFNFYHGLMAKGWERYRWLDYHALISRRIREDQTLTAVKYFTSRVTHQPEKLARQRQYLDALEKHTGIVPILGAFEMRPARCSHCETYFKRPQEKQTDVNMATHLVADAHEDRYDTAYIVCADADLAPAVSHVKDRLRKKVVLIDPPRRRSGELAVLADHHWHFPRSHLAGSQLPNPVVWLDRRGKERFIFAPDEWVAEPIPT